MPKDGTRKQKAVRRPGERRISRQQIDELLGLSCSSDPDERLAAAQGLCPCHTRRSQPEISAAIFRLLEDSDPRVRYAAWHTFEDGGIPQDEAIIAQLEVIFERESDPKVRRFVQWFFGPTMDTRRRTELQRMLEVGRQRPIERGKCDFCGNHDVVVERDYETMIPSGAWPRPALICARCAEHPSQRHADV